MSDEHEEQRRTAENSEARRCFFDSRRPRLKDFWGEGKLRR
jgi:hypothetical protein